MKSNFRFFSRKGFLLFVITYLYLISAYAQQTIIDKTVNNVSIQITAPQTLQTCVSSNIHVSLTNNNSSDINNFDLAFLNNSKVDILYTDLNNANILNDVANNKVTVTKISAGQTFQFDLPVGANCSNYVDATNTTVNGGLTIRPAAVSSSDFNFNFSIQSGFLEYISTDDVSDNISYIGHKGDAFVRRYNMRNTSINEYNGILYLEEDVTGNISIAKLELKVNSVSVNSINNPSIDPVTKKMTYEFPLSKIESNDEVELLEYVTITDCPISTGKLILKNGCNNDLCKELVGVSTDFQLVIGRGVERPNLVWEELDPFDYGTCLSNQNQVRKIKLTNNGSSNAENIILHFSPLADNIMNIMLVADNNFSYTTSDPSILLNKVADESSSLTIDEIENNFLGNNTTIEYSNCLASGTKIIQKVTYVVNSLKPGESVTFEYTESLCCVDKGINKSIISSNGWYAYDYYDDECTKSALFYGYGTWSNGNSDDAGSINPGVSQFPLSLVNNMYGCLDCGGNPNCFGNPSGNCSDQTLNQGENVSTDFTEEIRIKSSGMVITRFPMDMRKFRIVLDVAADGRLMLAPQAYSGATAQPGNIRIVDSKGVTYTPFLQTVLSEGTVTDLFGTTDFPSTPDNYIGARAYFEFDYTKIFDQTDINNFDTYGYKYINFDKLNKFLNSLEVEFEVSGKCDRSPTNQGPSYYYEKMYLQPNSDCQNCLLPLGELSKMITVNCPGCVFPGALVSKYEVERITIGLNDGDNNGLPDNLNIPGGKNINDKANLEMVTDNDVFRTTTRANFWGGSSLTYGSGANFGSLENSTGFAHRFLNNMCRVDMFSEYKNIFSVVVDALHPIKVDYFRNNSLVPLFSLQFTSNLNNITPGLQYISSTDGNGNFLIQVPVDLIRSMIGDPGFNYEASDAFEITCYYKVTGTFDLGQGKYYDNLDISTRCFFTGNSNPSVIIVKDVNNHNEQDASSPYGISGNRTDPSELVPSMNYICEAYGSGLILADIKEEYTFGTLGQITDNSNNCFKLTGASYGVLSDVKIYQRNANYLYDLFPNEVRNFSKVNKFRFIIPKGFVLDKSKSYLQSEFSYRQPSDYDYSRVYLAKTLDKLGTDLVIANPSYTDPVYGLMGVLYEATFNSPNQPYYFNNGFTLSCPWCVELNMNAGDVFPDYNEFVEQQVFIYFNPDCSLGAPGYVEYSDNDAHRAEIASVNGLPIDGIRAEVVSFDAATNSFNSLFTENTCQDYDCRAWFTQPDGKISLLKLQPNIIITKKNQHIPFRLSVDKDASNVFVYFTSSNSQFQFNNLYVNGSSAPLQIQNGVFQLGKLNGGQTLDFEIEAQYICNGNNNQTAQFVIHYGYDCDSYPVFDGTQLSKNTCDLQSDVLNVSLSTANMEISYNTSLGAVPCDEIDHALKIKSLGQGNIYIDQTSNTPADITVVVPSNLVFISGSAMLTVYNADGTIAQDASTSTDIQINLPDPLISGNSYIWNINGFLQLDALDLSLGKYLLLTFKTDPTCAFAGGLVSATVNAISYCNDNIVKMLSPAYNISFNQNCTPFSVNLTAPSGICEGDAANVSASIINANGIYTYNWVIDGVLQNPQNISWTNPANPLSNSLQIPVIPNPATVQIQVTDQQSGCVSSSSKVINILSKPTVDIGTDVSVCAGNKVTLSVSTNAPSITWSTGSHASTIEVTPVSTTTYSVTVTGTDGCSNTATKTVTVYPVPTVTATASAVCPPNNGTPYCTDVTANVSGGTPAYNYLWTASGSSTVLGTSSSLNVCPSATTGYTVTVTDANGCSNNAQATVDVSYLYTLKVNPNPYICGDNSKVCVTLAAQRDVSPGVIGMDYALKYDNTLFSLASTLTDVQNSLGVVVKGNDPNVAIKPKVDMYNDPSGANLEPNTGIVHLTIYYQAGTPLNTDFQGKGDVVTLCFNVIGNPQAGTSYEFKPWELQESYELFEKEPCYSTGTFSVISDPNYRGVVKFMNTNNVLASYYVFNWGKFHFKFANKNTDIYPGGDCSSALSSHTVTDNTGQFNVSLTNGNGLKIIRDIDNNYAPSIGTGPTPNFNYMRYVNGFDAAYASKITTLRSLGVNPETSTKKGSISNANLQPTGLQMIAADVNMNQRVRANDITLMQERTVHIIQEFPQLWNYDINTNLPLGNGPSLDWRFIDKTSYDAGSQYRISANYTKNLPNVNGTGFYRDKAPDVPMCLTMTPQCKNQNAEQYYAILLGDVINVGQYDPNTGYISYAYPNYGDSKVKLAAQSSPSITIDLGHAQYVGDNTYRIAVLHDMPSSDTLVSIDFGINYDEEKLSVVNVEKGTSFSTEEVSMVWNDYMKSELLLTSYTEGVMNNSAISYYLNIKKPSGGKILPKELGSMIGFLNGYEVEMKVDSTLSVTGVSDPSSTLLHPFIKVVPNPARPDSKIEYAIMNGSETNKISILNILGQVVREYNGLPESGMIDFNTEDLPEGVYTCIAYGSYGFKLAEKFVVTK